MVVEAQTRICDGHKLKWLMAAGVAWLEHHKDQVNNMNVFPVPDGDTGTNMLMTIQKAYQQVENSNESHIGVVSDQIARGALRGSRGNSGTILSYLFRGFANGLNGKEIMDAAAFAQAVQSSVDYAYETVSSVMEPVEGTILTVAREANDAVQDIVQHENDLKVILDHMIEYAYKSLDNTPNLLPKLKEAGVVDSGGMGLVYILEGIQRVIDGEPVVIGNQNGAANSAAESPAWEDALIPDDEEGYGYDVQFLMLGDNLDVAQVRRDISDMGWSPLVDGDSSLIKVHIHVHDPGEPLSYAIAQGVDLDDIVVENMQAQYLQYVQDRTAREHQPPKQVDGIAVVTVARGSGLETLLDEYGAARIIQGGQTMNPSTDDFLEMIDSLDNDEIILLPNNGNIIMAAEQAARTSNKTVHVVPSKTIQQGIAALLTYGGQKDTSSVDELAAAMGEALHHVISAEVTTATRNATIDGVTVQDGQMIGLVNGKLTLANDELNDLVVALLNQVNVNDYELVTLYYGDTVREAEAGALIAQLSNLFEEIEFELVAGKQPLYPYLISIE